MSAILSKDGSFVVGGQASSRWRWDLEAKAVVLKPAAVHPERESCGTSLSLVRDGRAEVGPESRANLQVTVNGLAALYSGWMSVYDASRAGLLTGATAEELAILARLFQGTGPYLNEMF